MEAQRKELVIGAARFAVTATVAYAASALVAATALGVVLDVPGPLFNTALVVVVGLVAFPFVFVAKCSMIANHWDGALAHALAGALVGTVASIILAEARHVTDVAVFAVIGMLASLSYLLTRTLWRRAVRW